MIDQIISNIQSEVQVDGSGKATFSIRAVARLGNKDDGRLVKDLKSGAALETSKLAEYLTSKGFEGAALASWGKTGVPDIAVPHIMTYWAFITDPRYRSEQAGLVLGAFAAVGVRAWAQQVAGWEAPELTIQQVLEAQMPAKPKAWQLRFKPPFWIALEQCYGLKRGQLACASFINHYVYKWFPEDVRDRIDEINPLVDNQRANLIHSHFDMVLQDILVRHIDRVTENLMLSDDRAEFKVLMANVPKITLHQVIKLSLRKEKVSKLLGQ